MKLDRWDDDFEQKFMAALRAASTPAELGALRKVIDDDLDLYWEEEVQVRLGLRQGFENQYKNADFSRLSMRGSDLHKQEFVKCNFAGADLSGVNCQNVVFKGCNLEEANFRKANLEGAGFTGALGIGPCRAAGADFREARLVEASLANIDLRQAHIAGADVYLARVGEGTFTNEQLNLLVNGETMQWPFTVDRRPAWHKSGDRND